MFLSVIIPVYKVENYIKQCIDSVVFQNIKDVEIILVDDGSPDNSPQICDEYAKNYNFIKVIHKENGGLSSARNEGLKNADGEYIMFLDSDDWWNPAVNMNSILKTVAVNESVEMFLLTSLDYVENEGYFQRNEHVNLKEIRTDNVENYYKDLLENGNLEVHAATKIIKKDFLLNNNLFFKKGIISEDNEWMLRILRCLKKVKIIDQPIYIYRVGREGSITNTVKKKNVEDMLSIVDESIQYYQLENEHYLKESELCYCAYLWFSALGLTSQLKKKERNDLIPKFKKTSSVCRYSNSPKTKIAYRVYKILGIRITMFVLGLYISLNTSKKINKHRMDNNNESIDNFSGGMAG